MAGKTINPRPILVTGGHRSGSTWVGKVLASAPRVFYVHEPLNARFAPHYLGTTDLPWFPRIESDEDGKIYSSFSRLLSGSFPPVNPGFFRLDRALRWRLRHAVTFRLAALRRCRFLLKDPFAIFSVEWLEACFGIQTILLIRHPAAFVASLKVKNWTFDFRNWTRQPALMNGPLASYSDEIYAAVEKPLDIIGQGCLLWNCLARHVGYLAEQDTSRLFLRHEDLCLDPLSVFKSIFGRIGLPWTQRSEQVIEQGAAATAEAISQDQFKSRLTKEERECISQRTAQVEQQLNKSSHLLRFS